MAFRGFGVTVFPSPERHRGRSLQTATNAEIILRLILNPGRKRRKIAALQRALPEGNYPRTTMIARSALRLGSSSTRQLASVFRAMA